MPSLGQVQNSFRNRRARIGDNNNIDHLKAYVELNIYDDITADDELFVFGDSLGEGSDDEHFHLGFAWQKVD